MYLPFIGGVHGKVGLGFEENNLLFQIHRKLRLDDGE